MKKTYYKINEELARIAHDANSLRAFQPETPAYVAEVDAAYELADEAAKRSPERADEAYELADRYARKYADWLNRKFRIDAMCPSIMISGMANFPIRKKQKQNAAWYSHWAEFSKVEGIKDMIRKIGTGKEVVKSSDADAVEKLKAKADRLKELHEAMKSANAKARKSGERAPYTSCMLSNNLQKIKNAEKRMAELEAQKAMEPSDYEAEIMGEPVMVVEDVDVMRLQVFFDCKPGEEARQALKRNGFRWSPKNGAWQRQLTDNARRALKMIEE